MPKGWITDTTMQEAFLAWFGKTEKDFNER